MPAAAGPVSRRSPFSAAALRAFRCLDRALRVRPTSLSSLNTAARELTLSLLPLSPEAL
ncbi:hypothetical protein [Corynebacterium sp. AOP12-C2-36]|uniref:hypothetical protein n=1 Tax=Corynebacterium sp. AOP12-C2-36 TaxID=3457723 RepID=UPI00403342F0